MSTEKVSGLEIDNEVGAAYLQLANNPIVRTCEVIRGVLVDLDEFDVVVGIEVLDLDVTIPRQALITRFHVMEHDVNRLDAIRPRVSYVMNRPEITVSTATVGAKASVEA